MLYCFGTANPRYVEDSGQLENGKAQLNQAYYLPVEQSIPRQNTGWVGIKYSTSHIYAISISATSGLILKILEAA